MSGKPNLFHYATSELSQDAFICWLLAWANRENSVFDTAMHEAGLFALNSLLCLHGIAPVKDVNLVIRRQFKRVDIVVEVGDELVLLIEDKANAAEQGDQLKRYIATISVNYPTRKVLPIFLKTGDQSDYKAAIEIGYKLFRRKDFLAVLELGKQQGASNTIFLDFLECLKQREQAGEAYAHCKYKNWDQFAWMGFYTRG